MRIIAFITYSADIGQILDHIGAETEPPHITPARVPPLWDGADAQVGDGVEVVPDWDEADQVVPDFDVEQRVSRQGGGNSGFANAAGQGCVRPKTGQADKSQATGLPLASKQTQCEAWDAKTLCQTCSHAVGFSIRQAHKAAGLLARRRVQTRV
jgi:hypothetical protein